MPHGPLLVLGTSWDLSNMDQSWLQLGFSVAVSCFCLVRLDTSLNKLRTELVNLREAMSTGNKLPPFQGV